MIKAMFGKVLMRAGKEVRRAGKRFNNIDHKDQIF